jgi:predicted CoA-substrate-specific enzyme activase
VRESDDRILVSEYLRTNGDPVGASRRCYAALLEQLAGIPVKIRGLGVTGSGRKIAGLHALTDAVYNEIIAHAEAALFFDPDVDTIFEIGGQDAKYTYLVNGVACDYAMNEACSAGTGSFLEEAAGETLGIKVDEIADWAMRGTSPPNFNDQCAAFISSDIKNALHEGIAKEDVVAGLVYSICMNYVNRVKGARPVGDKVFMQGGVCYNGAVPIAMAVLSGKKIVVPPEPGLMGAFGVALETKRRIMEGFLAPGEFDLGTLADREVSYKEPFICPGGSEKCDLGCEINRIVIEGKTYPFGGSCNRYYNVRHKIKNDAGALDYVQKRQRLVFKDFAPDEQSIPADAPRVGILPTFLTNTYYPLYANFFAKLGFRPELVKEYDPEGFNRVTAPFCFPGELSYGYLQKALEYPLDYIFLPHLKGFAVEGGQAMSKTCPLLQGEPYYLTATFTEIDRDKTTILMPIFDFTLSLQQIENDFLGLSKSLRRDRESVRVAFRHAWAKQQEVFAAFKEAGKQALTELQKNPEALAVVLTGRPYNAFTGDANKGIPHKFASRGVPVIPVDFLDLKDIEIQDHMYWASGQVNLKGAEYIKRHPQLFGAYITNFSCSPDSFIVGYYRQVLGRKPSLTLELDNHTADAGLETRVEAFLDIIQRYRILDSTQHADERGNSDFLPAGTIPSKKTYELMDSSGRRFQLTDPRVRVLFPSMGQRGSQILAAVFEGIGINAAALPPMDDTSIKLGRANTSGKECLPLQLTTGSLIHYLQNDRPANEFTVYFIPRSNGPCRLGQYNEFMKAYIKRNEIPDVALLSLTDEDRYLGLGTRFALRAFSAAVISDIFNDIHNTICLNAEDRDAALSIYESAWDATIAGMRKNVSHLSQYMQKVALSLKEIRHKRPLEELPTVLLTGEAYTRMEDFARRWIPERLLQDGFLTHVVPIHEFIHYIDWCVQHGILKADLSTAGRIKHRIKQWVVRKTERTLKQVMAESGCYIPRFIDIDHTLSMSAPYITPKMKSETGLTVGGPMGEVASEFCGAIAVGPFGCMPSRLSESILNQKMERKWVIEHRHDPMIDPVTREVESLPFLAVESDGSPFPQLIEARLETFIVQAKRMHGAMMNVKNLMNEAVVP